MSTHTSTSAHPGTDGLVVLAVDDEPRNLEEIAYLLGNNPRVRQLLTAFDAAEALRLIRGGPDSSRPPVRSVACPVDAVFADINMPGLSGMELGRVLEAFREPPALVFVTGHPEQAAQAYELGALDYILKPPRADRVERVLRLIQKVRSAHSGAAEEHHDEEVIPVELAGTTKLVPRSTVQWVEAQGDYARLWTTDGSHLVRIPLAQLEERWADAGFVRIHRSYLVSLPLISELQMGSSGYQVVVGRGEGAKTLPVSRRHTRDLKDRLVRGPKNNWGSR
ncbi:two component transcriptional regulator, LytTR family [Streptoalloteichus tenebrarius]|uniref:Two component transcriptional regulator, LytTR family n=1 Tax=Streptoalloteichus tenebrarius (strain ATCC 17920 / DSM 40477 / JCM 4838 / CBS 697.72 / NBRC 16177 / NCIMB 11028 / NRRL B-12390 / A12253. 1 / ISP 5477) TaxID=1933 RepID=A0ABT1HYV2_STRSD|nr:LytTR family DNA-binding domain-containing protein [Streptoalloteichus tenebrarius]MCP2260540.1 two component transcriptional regulator, LytTR family [Streptoalloteichus tenebrarius]BFF01880.1 LytTR family DNA-binding domain-containing protein [Streptoalloteichus tenebrarius]